jgi:SAM-dependent methyltransferase
MSTATSWRRSRWYVERPVAIDPGAQGFARVADLYERARPEYPDEAIGWLTERLDLRSGRTVVDLAAGTGKLTRRLVRTGARVVGVEPLAEMRAELERAVPGVEALEGTAEAIPLPDGFADAVTVAQAFHWFDAMRALAEIARVLRPGGRLALIWNTRDRRDELQREVDELLRETGVPVEWQRSVELDSVFQASPDFRPPEYREFPFEQRLDAAGLVERLASISYVGALEDDARADLLEQARRLGARRRAPFAFPYVTQVFVSARSSDAS